MFSRFFKSRRRPKVAQPIVSSEPASGPTLFLGAHHFGIETAIFNTNTINNSHSPAIDPYTILHSAIAIEATQTSKTAEYAPKCHPKTRTEIIADIVDIVETGKKPIIWFSGPAGGGKTCVMREVADRCQRAGWPTCTYFFSTRVPGLSTSTPFVATIAHQLLEAIPPIRPYILNTISTYPTIFQRSLVFQMDKLIIEPLNSDQFRSSTPNIPLKVVIVIDGYDECSDVNEREYLLQLLEFLDTKVPQSIVIVLASRPELDIRTAFDKPHLEFITRPVLLHNYDGKSDVFIYFADEFERIRQTHPRRAQIPEGWPVEEIVYTLIDKSSGHFVLPSTTIKYISNLRRNPVERLERVLTAFSLPSDDNPLAELDSLYTLILHPPGTDIPLMKRLLHCIIMMTEDGSVGRPSLPLLDDLLQLPSGTAEATLCDLHSVVQVLETIVFSHKSLEDFLLSPSRSRDLFQALYETRLDLALICSQRLMVWAMTATGNFGIVMLNYVTWAYDFHVSRFLETKPVWALIPDAILQFDARIIARSRYVLDEISTSWERVPSRDGMALSSHAERSNIPNEATEWHPVDYKVAILPHYDIKSGLYDQATIDELQYPVAHRLLALRLETVRDTHPMKTLIPDDWPIKDIINALVRKDQTDLLVPSLVLQYLRNPRYNPVETLERAIAALSSIPSSNDSPQAQLDALYTLILHPPKADIPPIKRLLHCMVGISQANELHQYQAASDYDLLFNLPAGASEAALSDIDSILFLFPSYTSSFHLESLQDYLLSSDRSHGMFQSEQETHLDITLARVPVIQKWAELSWNPDQRWKLDPTSGWRFHLEKSIGEKLSIPAALLKFDLRLIWRYKYACDIVKPLARASVMKVLGPSHMVQLQHCTDTSCSWCRILNRMKSCAHRVEAICSADMKLSVKDKFENLPRFDMESGLYDEEEIDQLSYPVGRRLLALRAATQSYTSSS